jgi:hypothetical protein
MRYVYSGAGLGLFAFDTTAFFVACGFVVAFIALAVVASSVLERGRRSPRNER